MHNTMSFPPNLGITNSLILESDYYLLFQEFPSILPTLNQISSPFSKNRMITDGYSRIDQKKSSSTRSKSVDFADLTSLHHKPRSTPKYLTNNSTRELMAEPNIALKSHDSIPEHDEEAEEVIGIILSRKPPAEQQVGKRSLSIKRSASVCEGYSRNDGLKEEEEENDDDQYVSGLITQKRRVKKKSKFFGAFKRLFGL